MNFLKFSTATTHVSNFLINIEGATERYFIIIIIIHNFHYIKWVEHLLIVILSFD